MSRRTPFPCQFHVVGKLLDEFTRPRTRCKVLAPTAVAATSHAHGSPTLAEVLQSWPNIESTIGSIGSASSPRQWLLGCMGSIHPPNLNGKSDIQCPPTGRSRGVELVVDLPSTTRRFRLRHLSVQPMTQPTVIPAGSFAFESIAFAEEAGSTLKLGGSGRRLSELANERKQIAKFFLVEFFLAQRPSFGLELQDALVALTNCFLADIHAATTWHHSFNLIQCIVAELQRVIATHSQRRTTPWDRPHRN